MKFNFRAKVFLGIIAVLLFWFVLFYPFILPFMDKINVYPLVATIIFEGLFFASLWLLSLLILGKKSKHTLRLTLAIFLISHIWDSVEPPFVLNTNGSWTLNQSSLVSWDYGVSHFLNDVFGLSGSALYYVTFIGGAFLMLLILIFIVKPQILGKVVRKSID